MIVQRMTQVHLRKEYTKILYLFQAMNQTFVFLGSSGVMRDCLVHVDKEGRQKFCHYFQRPVDSLIMMNEFEAVVMETRANVISILDLHTYQFKRIPHYFMVEESDQSFLWSFPQTKYMAVVQHGRVNDCRLKLTYYNYPQKNPISVEGKPLIYHKRQVFEKEFYVTEGEWTFEYQLVKANNHSMIVWYKARHDKVFEFRFYKQDRSFRPMYVGNSSVDVENGWEYKSVNIMHRLDQLYLNNKLAIAVLNVFEIENDRLFVSCVTSRETPKANIQQSSSTYVVDLMTKTCQQTPHNLGKYQLYQIDHMLLGSCHMIRTFYYINSQIQQTPVYYFSNTNFQHIFTQTWKCTYKTKYAFPGYDSYTMLENEYENGGRITEFTCKYKKLIEFKEILMFFMLEINEEFDDDLLQEAIQLICD